MEPVFYYIDLEKAKKKEGTPTYRGIKPPARKYEDTTQAMQRRIEEKFKKKEKLTPAEEGILASKEDAMKARVKNKKKKGNYKIGKRGGKIVSEKGKRKTYMKKAFVCTVDELYKSSQWEKKRQEVSDARYKAEQEHKESHKKFVGGLSFSQYNKHVHMKDHYADMTAPASKKHQENLKNMQESHKKFLEASIKEHEHYKTDKGNDEKGKEYHDKKIDELKKWHSKYSEKAPVKIGKRGGKIVSEKGKKKTYMKKGVYGEKDRDLLERMQGRIFAPDLGHWDKVKIAHDHKDSENKYARKTARDYLDKHGWPERNKRGETAGKPIKIGKRGGKIASEKGGKKTYLQKAEYYTIDELYKAKQAIKIGKRGGKIVSEKGGEKQYHSRVFDNETKKQKKVRKQIDRAGASTAKELIGLIKKKESEE